jgi:hypothetical protein
LVVGEDEEDVRPGHVAPTAAGELGAGRQGPAAGDTRPDCQDH